MMSLDGYYGKSTLYRILRPLCLAQMVEGQIAIADFSVDKGASICLRFRAAFDALSGDILVGGHPDLDWNSQRGHVFADNLTRCAHALIVSTATESRAMTFHEFSELLDDDEKTDKSSRSLLDPERLHAVHEADLLDAPRRLWTLVQRVRREGRSDGRLRAARIPDARAAAVDPQSIRRGQHRRLREPMQPRWRPCSCSRRHART